MTVSIVTVCFNAEKTIKQCVESVLRIEDADFEYIVIDGKSTDNTLKFLDEYKERFNDRRR